jgi:hypothetical protein
VIWGSLFMLVRVQIISIASRSILVVLNFTIEL